LIVLAAPASPANAQADPRGRPRPVVIRPYIDLGVTSVHDTNLERRFGGPSAFGMEAGTLAGVRAAASSLSASLDYRLGVHRFETGGRWNWVSHTTRAVLAARAGALTISATGEYLVGTPSEDREIGNQYGILPRLELRLDSRNRLRLQLGYRMRRFGDLGGDRAHNRLAGVDYRIGASGSANLELGSRFETNDTQNPRTDFRRWTHRLRFSSPVGRDGEIAFQVRHYSRLYPERFLRMEAVDDVMDPDSAWRSAYRQYEPGTWPAVIPLPDESTDRFPRHDLIWIPSIEFGHRVGGGLELEFGYQYEIRVSNDLRKDYSGHTLRLGTRLRR
jgi:hypothetical protein